MKMGTEPEQTTNADAPGSPGISPTWCSAAKETVGCALGPSRVWFTIGGGIINEVFYPRVDIPQIRDLGFIVADDQGSWVEVKRLDNHKLVWTAQGIPAIDIIHQHDRFELRLRIAPDTHRDVLLVDVQLEGEPNLRPYALLAPHLGGTGHNNQAGVNIYRGRRVLWAKQGPFGLALAAVDKSQCDAWDRTSAGYVGASDGWQDFFHHGRMQWQYSRAGPGNVALMGELPRQATLALGFASSKESAATLAISALLCPFAEPWQQLLDDWSAWHRRCEERCDVQKDIPDTLRSQFLTSAIVLRVHQDKIHPGAMVASLSAPWGNTRDERGGYHLVWPRDLVESAGALLALGAEDEARDILRYLIATQHADGHWYQNQWLGGKPYWQGVQLDEAAFPVILAARLAKRKTLQGIEVADMISRALGFIARNGPISQQDRWEEDTGINAFTLSICIAALVEGAGWLEPAGREFALALADYWNAHIEDWTAVYDTPLARRNGVHGYYIRNAPTEHEVNPRALLDVLPIKNRIHDPALSAAEQVGVDFLQLVRFGLRLADDPLILDSIQVIDRLLKVDTPSGPSWHRYNGDGYGEHDDGAPFDGVGRGRAWPLLTGERGHYELAAGKDPLPYLEGNDGYERCGRHDSRASVGQQLPFQHRDSIQATPTGLQCPWSGHMPNTSSYWSPDNWVTPMTGRMRPGNDIGENVPRYNMTSGCRRTRFRKSKPGRPCSLAFSSRARFIGVSMDGNRYGTLATRDTGIGLHVAELETATLHAGQRIDFTFRHMDTGEWLGRDYAIAVKSS